MSPRDAQVMQHDAVSPYALSLVDRVLPYLEKRKEKLPKRAQSILNLIRGWDGGLTTKSRAAAVYTMFLELMNCLGNFRFDRLAWQLILIGH